MTDPPAKPDAAAKAGPPADARPSAAAPGDRDAKGAPAAPSPEDEVVAQVRHHREAAGARTEFDGVLREALGRLATEGRLSAAHTIVNFHGAVDVGGDFSISRRTGRRRGREADLIGPVDVPLEHFVTPPEFDRAAKVLERTGLVVLSGPEATGKHWAALGLSRRTLPDGPVFYLRLHQSLTEIATLSLKPGTAYVLTDATATMVSGLDDHWLETTARLFRDAGSCLVVTVSHSARLGGAGRRGEYLVEPFAAPSVEAVVRAVAAAGAEPGTVEALTELFADPDVRALLDRPHGPHFARRIAAALLTVVLDGHPLEAALAPLRDVQPRVVEWFTDNTEVSHRAFAVATAVLEGASYAAVADAALDLQERIRRRGVPATDLSFRAVLREQPSWIDVVEVFQETAYGVVPVEVVRFADAGLQPAVLRYAFDRARPAP